MEGEIEEIEVKELQKKHRELLTLIKRDEDDISALETQLESVRLENKQKFDQKIRKLTESFDKDERELEKQIAEAEAKKQELQTNVGDLRKTVEAQLAEELVSEENISFDDFEITELEVMIDEALKDKSRNQADIKTLSAEVTSLDETKANLEEELHQLTVVRAELDEMVLDLTAHVESKSLELKSHDAGMSEPSKSLFSEVKDGYDDTRAVLRERLESYRKLLRRKEEMNSQLQKLKQSYDIARDSQKKSEENFVDFMKTTFAQLKSENETLNNELKERERNSSLLTPMENGTAPSADYAYMVPMIQQVETRIRQTEILVKKEHLKRLSMLQEMIDCRRQRCKLERKLLLESCRHLKLKLDQARKQLAAI